MGNSSMEVDNLIDLFAAASVRERILHYLKKYPFVVIKGDGY
jgi:hypothetical protein